MNQAKQAASDRLPTVAAVCDKHGPDAARMEAHLRATGEPARWYALRDLDDVDREVRAGHTQRVVFIRWQDLLAGLWNGEMSLDAWLSAHATVGFVESSGDNADCLTAIAQAWSLHKRARRRRQAVSGIILSIIALICAFIVVQG